ncbi:hypothetical protein [Acidimangrovimonas sediminis]|uniref:hypothetical protein n=1 Tax=Acidimangrovimonas sediminis TaxID=2056283 RepID=UPI00130495AC|nr:hypothetical protein [Acidimangrovimonas sediminis]
MPNILAHAQLLKAHGEPIYVIKQWLAPVTTADERREVIAALDLPTCAQAA